MRYCVSILYCITLIRRAVFTTSSHCTAEDNISLKHFVPALIIKVNSDNSLKGAILQCFFSCVNTVVRKLFLDTEDLFVTPSVNLEIVTPRNTLTFERCCWY